MSKRDPTESSLPMDHAKPASLLAQVDARPRSSGIVICGIVLVGTAAVGLTLAQPQRMEGRRVDAAPAHADPMALPALASTTTPTPTLTPSPAPEVRPPAASATAATSAMAAAPRNAPPPHARTPRTAPRTNARHTKARGAIAPSIPIGEDIPPLPTPEAGASVNAIGRTPAVRRSAPPDPVDAPLPEFPIPPPEAPPTHSP